MKGSLPIFSAQITPKLRSLKKHEEKFVLNAITQSATVINRIGRFFNQPDNATTNETVTCVKCHDEI